MDWMHADNRRMLRHWFRIPCLLAFALSANAAVVSYDISIVFNFGPQAGATGTGQVVYDTAQVQRVGAFTFVAPGGLGLLSLQMNVLGLNLNLANAVNAPIMPTLYLDDATLAPGSFLLWGAWGNASAVDGPGIQFARSVQYSTFVHSYFARRDGTGGSTVGTTPGPGDQNSDGSVFFTQSAPEPWTVGLCASALVLIACRRRLRYR
jgi:hypothetical protein